MLSAKWSASSVVVPRACSELDWPNTRSMVVCFSSPNLTRDALAGSVRCVGLSIDALLKKGAGQVGTCIDTAPRVERAGCQHASLAPSKSCRASPHPDIDVKLLEHVCNDIEAIKECRVHRSRVSPEPVSASRYRAVTRVCRTALLGMSDD